MASIFERMRGSDILKYFKYIKRTIGDGYFELLNDDDPGVYIQYVYEYHKKLRVPLGRDLDRLDHEYLWMLNSNLDADINDVTEEDINNARPEMESREVDWVSEEREYVIYRKRDNIETYLDNRNFGTGYLNDLYSNDEIEPWEWENIDKDITDSDVTDSWFEI